MRITAALLLASCNLLTGGAQADAPRFPISRSYDEVQAFLADIAAKNPANASFFDLGVSDSGATIRGLKIGNGPVKSMVVAAHHGNEYGSTEVAKGVAAAFAADPLQDQTVFVVPVLNIGGYNKRARWESAKGRSWDPNRNYPGPCGSEGQFTLKSTSALAQFIEAEGIVNSATLHTHYPAVVYPWGLSSRDLSTPYDDLFKMLAQAATVESRYQTGNSTEVIYAANGTYEDYAYWKHGVWSMLFELGYSHSPSQAQVDEMVRVNVPGIRRMFAQSPTQRAENHDFTGKCLGQNVLGADGKPDSRYIDKHDE